MTGIDILTLGNKHVGDPYILGSRVVDGEVGNDTAKACELSFRIK